MSLDPNCIGKIRLKKGWVIGTTSKLFNDLWQEGFEQGCQKQVKYYWLMDLLYKTKPGMVYTYRGIPVEILEGEFENLRAWSV